MGMLASELFNKGTVILTAKDIMPLMKALGFWDKKNKQVSMTRDVINKYMEMGSWDAIKPIYDAYLELRDEYCERTGWPLKEGDIA